MNAPRTLFLVLCVSLLASTASAQETPTGDLHFGDLTVSRHRSVFHGEPVFGSDAISVRSPRHRASRAVVPTPPLRACEVPVETLVRRVEEAFGTTLTLEPGLTYGYSAQTGHRVVRLVPRGLEALRLGVSFELDLCDLSVLDAQPLLQTVGEGEVFLHDPDLDNGQLTRVALPGMDTASAGDFLSNGAFTTLNCIDDGQLYDLEPVGLAGLSVHMCSPQPKAEANASGDFLFTPLDDPTNPASGEDELAEVMAFYHVTRAVQQFESLGFPGLIGPTNIVVNLRVPDVWQLLEAMSPNGDLLPFPNAFACGAGNCDFIAAFGLPVQNNTLLFGQGNIGDFAYDATIVTHELTHLIVGRLAGLASEFYDEQGFNPQPGSLNEGYADYFGAVFNEQVEIGAYVFDLSPSFKLGRNTIRVLPKPLRRLDLPARCPQDLRGEVHDDSLLWSRTLWAFRDGLDASQRTDFDTAVLAGMAMLMSRDGFEDAARVTTDAVRAAFGDATADAFEAHTRANGLWGCERVVDQAHIESVSDSFTAGGGGWIKPWTPPALQVMVDVPENLPVLQLDFVAAPPMFPFQFLGYGGQSSYRGLLRADGPATFIYVPSADGVGYDVSAEGTSLFDIERVGSADGLEVYRAYVEGLQPGRYAVAVVNSGDGDGRIANLKFSNLASVPEPEVELEPTYEEAVEVAELVELAEFEDVEPLSDVAEVPAEADAEEVNAALDANETVSGSGCACQLQGQPREERGWPWVAALSVLGVVFMRRRRGRC
ncbi:MAG: hypothetical protein CO108_23190 [Deltaproteobacteria bacterium CG_4_9_14_3_um_filter_63_12]|nr:MAG: hypothetical protein CO108_23190 [Deltaproteobacteria bacterium CG_4_9_14_3_um_filter_63_12]